MSAAHTPGPWHVGELSLDIITTKGLPVCSPSDDFNEDQWAIDSRLIAAAPDGLVLARMVVRYFGDDPIPSNLDGDIALRGAARALIAKVES